MFKLVISLLLAAPALGTITVSEVGVTANNLVESLLQDDSIEFSDATLSGHGCAAFFGNGQSVTDSFPNAGVMLATGNPENALGPDDSEGAGNSFGVGGDSDLDAIAFQTTFDACKLEFKFICPNEEGCDIFFNYVFGSEEYLEFIDQFNDVFALFLDGTNIALLPGSMDVVSINTVNNGDNPEYFVFNPDPASNPNAIDIQADGFTTTLTATQSDLTEGEHTIKMVIADGGDGVLDSWLWIQGGTFGFEPPTPPNGGGDPHFMRFGHQKRSTFHGECDLVLLESRSSDLAVHIRTTSAEMFSYIEKIAMKIGDATLEFGMNYVMINGETQSKDAFPMKIGDAVKVQQDPEGTGKTIYQVDLPNGLSLGVKAAKEFLSVSLKDGLWNLKDSVGMFGKYPTGDLKGRDGRDMTDFEEYGFEWQVRPQEDGKLFAEERAPELPYERCRMPSVQANRRLRVNGNRKLHEQATATCEAAHPNDVDLCIADVMMTGDLDILESW